MVSYCIVRIHQSEIMYETFKLNNEIELKHSMGLGSFSLEIIDSHFLYYNFFELKTDTLWEMLKRITDSDNISKIGTDEYFAHNFEIFDGFITGRISHRVDDGELFFSISGESDWLTLSFHCYSTKSDEK